MKHYTGSAVARVTKDRDVRPQLPSTVENQLEGIKRQLLTIAHWNVRTLLDREAADRPERRTALVAVELPKYNIDIAALCKTRFAESGSLTTCNTLSFRVANPKEKEGRPEWALLLTNNIVKKLTEMPRPVYEIIMTTRLPLSKDYFATIISVYADNDKPI